MSYDVLLLAINGLAVSALILMFCREKGLLQPACIYAVLCALHFFVPGVLLAVDLAPPFVSLSNEPYLADALAFVACSLIGATIGAVGAQRVRFSRYVQTKMANRDTWSPRRVVVVAGILVVASWVTKAYVFQSNAYFQIQRAVQGELEGPFYALVRMIEQFSLFAVAILATYNWRSLKSESKGLTSAIFVLSAMELMYWLPAGRKEESILCVVLPLAVRYLSTGVMPSKKVMATVALFTAVLFPAMYYYRVAIELNLTDLSASEALSLVEIASSSVGGAEVSIAPAEVAFNRISLLEPVAASVRLVDKSEWQMFYGSSYSDLLLSAVPRALWPGKPDFHYGNEFGTAAGFLADGDEETSISVTYMGEAFLNFAWLGFLPMLGVGFFYGTLFRLAHEARDILTARVIFIIALPRLLYIGNTFALDFGGHLKLLPFFFFLCVLMRSGRET